MFESHTIHNALHGFSDASTAVFAAVVYLRTVNNDNSINISLLTAKVTLLKTLSIPRLELSAALFLARLIYFVRASFESRVLLLDRLYHCTYLAESVTFSDDERETFVANRVSAVQTLLLRIPWHHVPTN